MKYSCFFFLIFLISCSQKENHEKKEQNNSLFSKLELNGSIDTKKTFRLISDKGTINEKNDFYNLESVSFFLFDNNKLFYVIKAEKGSYDKNRDIFNLFKIKANNSDKEIFIDSEHLMYDNNSKLITGKNNHFRFNGYQIKSNILNTNNIFEKFSMKKVHAQLKY